MARPNLVEEHKLALLSGKFFKETISNQPRDRLPHLSLNWYSILGVKGLNGRLMFIVPLMEAQTTFLFEALATCFTGEGSEVGMTAHVVCQSFFPGKCTTTDVTGIGFLSSVDAFMLLQVVLP